MTNLEKTLAIAGLLATAFTVGVGWNSLSNRIEEVDSKVGEIQTTLGSTTCTAILSRQIEAIEKDRTAARTALEGLSRQYRCVPEADTPMVFEPSSHSSNISTGAIMRAGEPALANQLEAVDVLLNESDASKVRR